MVWPILKTLAAPYFKLGLATAAGLLVSQTLFSIGPFLAKGIAYTCITFANWAWAKFTASKDRLLSVLSWALYLAIALVIVNYVSLPYLDGRPEEVDAWMAQTWEMGKSAVHLASDAWALGSTYVDATLARLRESGLDKAVALVTVRQSTPALEERQRR